MNESIYDFTAVNGMIEKKKMKKEEKIELQKYIDVILCEIHMRIG